MIQVGVLVQLVQAGVWVRMEWDEGKQFWKADGMESCSRGIL